MRTVYKTTLGVVIAVMVLALAWIAWPVATALKIREAMLAGDIEVLNRKIEWDSVRASLKSSLTPETMARLAQDPDSPKPSTWQKIKAAVAPRFAETVIERYVTAEQLPVFLGYRETYRGTIRPALGLKPPATVMAGTWLQGTFIDKGLSFWKRVRRAAFTSPSRVSLEVEDDYHPGRRYTGVLERRGWEWKLTGLSISGL